MKNIIRFSTAIVLILSALLTLSAKTNGDEGPDNKQPAADQIPIASLTMERQYLPKIEKTVSTQLVSCYDWRITKTFENDNIELLAGEKVNLNYQIKVNRLAPKKLYFIKGELKVSNTNPYKILYVKISELVNGQALRLKGVDDSGYVSVPAGKFVDLSFEVASEFKPLDGETLTTLNFYSTIIENRQKYSFKDVHQVSEERNEIVSVIDAGNNKIWTDIRSSVVLNGMVCVDCIEVSETDFVGGKYLYDLSSSARIIETGASAYANAKVTYYAPVCSLKTNGYISETKQKHEIEGLVDIYNPHPSKEMKLKLASYFNLKPLNLENSEITIKPGSSAKYKFNQVVRPEKHAYNDVQIYLNDVEFYLTEIISFESKAKVDQEMLLVSQ